MKRIFYILFVSALFVGCSDDAIENTGVNADLQMELSLRNVRGITIKDGRLCFPSKEVLQEIHSNLSEQTDKAIYDYLQPFYSQEFISLRPVLPEESETDAEIALLQKQMDKRVMGINTSELSNAMRARAVEVEDVENEYDRIAELIDNTDEVIGDDVFAALINYLGEIQIGNEVYKYTDVGMFSISENNKSKIDNYLVKNNISDNPLIPTEYNQRTTMLNRLNTASRQVAPDYIEDGISYFLPSSFDDDEPMLRSTNSGSRSDALTGTSNSTSNVGSRGNTITTGDGVSRNNVIGNNTTDTGGSRGGTVNYGGRSDALSGGRDNSSNVNPPRNNGDAEASLTTEVQNYLQTISDCNPKSGFFGSLFGTNQVCKNRYAKKRRVKIKAFCYNYGIVYHVGTKVKHQKKGGLGLWRTSKASYIEMGVEYAQFTYDYSKIIGASIPKAQQAPKIAFGGNQYTDFASIGMSGLEVKSFKINSYPSLFRGDIVIEQFGIGLAWPDKIIKDAIKSGNKALTSKKLNEYFWKSLWSSTNSFLSQHATSSNISSIKNRTLLVKLIDEGKILVQKSYSDSGYNLGVRSRTMDWGFVIGISANPDNNWSLSGDLSGSALIKPRDFKCSMYGVARGEDGKLHGVKMSF